HGATAVLAYRDMGIMPQAMVNYLVRLGWAHGDQELFTMEELKQHFSLEGINAANPRFDEKKLLWVSANHIRCTPPEQLAKLCKPFLAQANLLRGISDEYLMAVVKLLQTRIETLADLVKYGQYFFTEEYPMNPQAQEMIERNRAMLAAATEALYRLSVFTPEHTEQTLRGLAQQMGLGAGKVLQPLRAALTGTLESPTMFEMLSVMGRERVLRRLARVVG
ncbi:MAG: glutamate--tRNA ligase, partial [Deinococcus sp.]|nr:glutamate--tRNA ligase [Deinococcus sp.]